MKSLLLIALLTPLLSAVIAGFLGKKLGDSLTAVITIILMTVSTVASIILFYQVTHHNLPAHRFLLYQWVDVGHIHLRAAVLVDHLTVIMLLVVTLVSTLVHLYSVGYMRGDLGFARFFSYMSLFTFMMLTLVTADNFLQLFFGWEGVGLVSYLLIGFWYHKDSVAVGSFKAFIVNRIGDVAFLLGIAAVLKYAGSLQYTDLFTVAPKLAHLTVTIFPHFLNWHWSVASMICILLFIGAMAKSAQIPLHVWLPESMEGPTPISALIHAATMVTAGVYLVARLSPLFEYSTTALNMILLVGSTGALFLGLVGIVQNDIKRVIAYSTMSQLGYMMAANGTSAFSAGIFHLATHAAFKALLFLAAGSVIVACHHEQDMRKMGGLRRKMPITYVTFLIGALALAAVPPFAGFYSKDAIIEAVSVSHLWSSGYAYWCLTLGAFVTSLYIFRAFFMTFHGVNRSDDTVKDHIKESSWVITVPLIVLAILSVGLGVIWAVPLLYSKHAWLANAVMVLPIHASFLHVKAQFHGVWSLVLESVQHLPFWMMLLGVFVAWLSYCICTDIPAKVRKHCQWGYALLSHKYGFDAFNQLVLVRPISRLANYLFYVADMKWLDAGIINGAGRVFNKMSLQLKRLQTGYLYHYALIMVLGLLLLLVGVVVL